MNLLPSIEKSIIRREYYKRLAVISLMLSAVLIVTATVSGAVSYIISGYEISRLSQELSSSVKTSATEGVVTNSRVIKNASDKLKILGEYPKRSLGYDLSQVFYFVFDKRSGIRLTSFAYTQTVSRKRQTRAISHNVIISGVAPTRGDLLQFVKILESHDKVVSVDLPISNLIGDKDIEFSVTLAIKNL